MTTMTMAMMTMMMRSRTLAMLIVGGDNGNEDDDDDNDHANDDMMMITTMEMTMLMKIRSVSFVNWEWLISFTPHTILMPIRFTYIISISNFLSNDLAIRIKTIGIENNLVYDLVFFRRNVQIFHLPRGVFMDTLYKILPH
jgi:hypothetical protein